MRRLLTIVTSSLITVLVFGITLLSTANFVHAATITIFPIEDTYVDSDNPNANYVGSHFFNADKAIWNYSPTEEKIGLLKFDLSNKIPIGSTLNSATLRLMSFYVTSPTPYIGAYKYSNNDWNLGTVTWNNFTGGTYQYLSAISVPYEDQYYYWDVLSAVNSEILSLALRSTRTEVGYEIVDFRSFNSSIESDRPVLTIDFTPPAAGTTKHLYFPHVDTSLPWQTEIAIINTSDQTVTGTLRALGDEGQLVETIPVTLSARGRRQITVANEFTDDTDIGYIIFDTTSDAVQGYTKHYMAGNYRAAIPAVKEVNTSDIYISHIASDADWWTGVSLVNTTSAPKQLTVTFNNGQSRPYTLNANEHRVFEIAQEFFNNQPQPDIQSAVITNASGVIGLELFGSLGWGTQMGGILLTDKTTSTIYYPHMAGNEWWTGIVAYNPSELECTISITPYSALGVPLSPSILPIPGKKKYIGPVAALGLPDQTAWFKMTSTSPITGFELFGTIDGKQLAAYAEKSGVGAKAGVFAKIEKNGWTGIAFVNTEEVAATVTLTAYDDSGIAVATPQVLTVGGHAKVVNPAEALFSQNISSATYIAYSSDRNVVGFQLNGSSDGMMLDGLPALGGTN